MTTSHLDLSELASVLEKAGWDVSLGDALIAVKAGFGGIVRLSADAGGRVVLTLTRQTSPDELLELPTPETRVSCYRRHIEEITVPLTARGAVETARQLDAVLHAIGESNDDKLLH